MPRLSRRLVSVAIACCLLGGCKDEGSGGDGDDQDAAVVTDGSTGGADTETPTDVSSDTGLQPDAPPASDVDHDTLATDTAQNRGDTMAPRDMSAGNCALPPPFDKGATYSKEIHVDPSAGSGGNGSKGSPYQSIATGLQQATAGTKVILHSGKHSPDTYVGSLKGTMNAPIKVVGRSGATIEGGSTGLQISEAEYVVLEDLTIDGPSQNGLNMDDGGSYNTPAEFIVLRNVTVRNVGTGGNEDCIKLSGVDKFWVTGSDVSKCSGQGIDMVGCHAGQITSNHLHDKPGTGIQAKGGSANILINGNKFTGVTGRAINAGGSTGLQYFRPKNAPHEAKNIEAFGNIFVDVGAESGAPIAYVGCDACSFYNNTIIRPKTWIARILQETTGSRFIQSRNGLFANNIVYFRTSDIRTWVNVGPNTKPNSFRFTNNLWYATDDSSFSGPNFRNVPQGQNQIIQKDPSFADPGNGDYHLSSGSPAVGVGKAMGMVPDYEEKCYGSPPAVGAFAAP